MYKLAGWCTYAHQPRFALQFLTSLRVTLAERKLYTDLCAKSQHEAAEGADFPKIDPDPVGVAKIKVAFNLVLLTEIPVVCMACACHARTMPELNKKDGYRQRNVRLFLQSA